MNGKHFLSYHVEDSNAQKRWLITEGYAIIFKLYEDSTMKEVKEQIKTGFGPKGLQGKYGFAAFQSKTKVIFPELLHIDSITHLDDLNEWANQKETIIVFDEHCAEVFEELPTPVQVDEIRWRDR
jgi:hypothetical protein